MAYMIPRRQPRLCARSKPIKCRHIHHVGLSLAMTDVQSFCTCDEKWEFINNIVVQGVGSTNDFYDLMRVDL